jgi:hypothetical protein
VTPEGLAVASEKGPDGLWTVREVGRTGVIVHEYIEEITPLNDSSTRLHRRRESVHHLLELLRQLKEDSESLDGEVVKRLAATLRWNRKAAARRLRRYVREHDGPLEIADPVLQALARDTLESGPMVEIDIGDLIDQTASNKNGHLDHLYEYERRKADEPTLVVRDLPPSTRSLILEANEAYRWGLFRTTFAICRAVLEDVLRRAVREQQKIGPGAIPIDDENLYILINCIPERFLSAEDAGIARRIKNRGNHALHDADASFSEDQAYTVLYQTTRIIRLLINGGALGPLLAKE